MEHVLTGAGWSKSWPKEHMELIWQINQLKSFDYWFPLLQFVIIFSKKVDVNDWICDSFEETIKNVMDYETVSLMHILFSP